MLKCFILVTITVSVKAAPGYYVNGAYGAYGHSVPPATSYVSRTDYSGKSVPVVVGHATPVVTKSVISPPITYNLLEPYPVSGYQYGHQAYPSGASSIEYDYGDDYIHGAASVGGYGLETSAGGDHGYGATLGGSYGHGTAIVAGPSLGTYVNRVPIGGASYGHKSVNAGAGYGLRPVTGGTYGYGGSLTGAGYGQRPIIGGSYGYGGILGKYGAYDH